MTCDKATGEFPNVDFRRNALSVSDPSLYSGRELLLQIMWGIEWDP
jgi:hypothetical protein